jgi:uncharacterized protein YggE
MRIAFFAFLLTVVHNAAGWGQQPLLYDDRPKITVSGDAVIYARPDSVVISFGVETSDPDISIARQKCQDIMKKAMAALKESGLPDKEIQTDHLSLQPRYRSDGIKDVFLGYFVRNAFAVTLNETAKLEDMVARVMETGVNYIHNVDFQTVEFKKYREQARELALRAAREKAERMASVLGQSVGSPLQINEIGGGSPWTYYSSWGGWGSARMPSMAQNVIQDLRGSSENMDAVPLGKIAIRASVNVTFELKR